VRLTHLGHACVLAESADARLLIDPGVFSHGFEELTDLDAIFVTHQHMDHLDGDRLAPLLAANDAARVFAEPETAAQLREIGIEAAPIHPGDTVTLGRTTVTGVGGIHAEIHPDVPLIGNVGLVLDGEGEPRVFHPGDSYGAVPDAVDVLLLPLTAPWARVAMTVDFAREVGPRRIIPIHDAIATEQGRGVYLKNLGMLVEGAEVVDLAGKGSCEA
jgi:L-ascorbate metabolism protein UlaG (beta-lactamase superfamily)